MVHIDSLWAKSDPYCSLIDHLITTGLCASELLRNGALCPVARKLSCATGLTFDETVSLLSYIAALHDIGKAHPCFQAKDLSMPGIPALKEAGMLNVDTLPKYRHEEYSAEILRTILPEILNTDDEAIKAICVAIGLHHQGKGKPGNTNIKKNCNRSEWEKLHKQLNDILVKTFDPPRRYFKGSSDAVAYLIMGVVILSDWIASD